MPPTEPWIDKGSTIAWSNLTQDQQALNHVKSLGYQQVPVIIAGDDHWSGFRPDKIGALANALTS